MFTPQNYVIGLLIDYRGHLMSEIDSTLLKRGYIVILIGGGISEDAQLNDTGVTENKYSPKISTPLVLISREISIPLGKKVLPHALPEMERK